jgi:hypothetical protein
LCARGVWQQMSPHTRFRGFSVHYVRRHRPRTVAITAARRYGRSDGAQGGVADWFWCASSAAPAAGRPPCRLSSTNQAAPSRQMRARCRCRRGDAQQIPQPITIRQQQNTSNDTSICLSLRLPPSLFKRSHRPVPDDDAPAGRSSS